MEKEELLGESEIVDEEVKTPSYDQIDFELMRLKDEYRRMKVFGSEHTAQTRAHLETLRLQIRLIEQGIKEND